jgi:hypothetical protein
MYEPQVNDYVYWNDRVEGWVYFKDEEYITIEIGVKPKDDENYQACSIHRNDRLLVLCFADQWNELTYVKSRDSRYEEEKNIMETLGKGNRRKGIKE